MTQYNSVKMAAGRPAVTGGLAQKKQTLATQVWVNDSVLVNDTLYFGKLPKGAIVTGGRIYSGRLASGASASCCCLELVLGFDQILQNASATTFSTASGTSAFGHFGPLNFSTATSSNPNNNQFEAGFSAPLGGLLATNGPLTVNADGNVFATVVVSAGAGSGISGYLNIELDYITGTYS